MRAALALAGLLLAAPAQAQVVFDMNYTAGADPLAGWDEARTPDSNWSRTRVAGGGPSSQDIYRLSLTYNGATNGGQHNWGWRGNDSCTISGGSSCYYRWRYRFTSATTYQCRDWETGSDGANCINKFLLVNNDGCTGGACRFILTVESDRTAGNYQWCLQKDGGDDRACTGFYQETTWLDVQVQLLFSSALNAADGGYRIWVDTNTQGSPTQAVTGVILNTTDDPTQTRLGGFMNHGVENGDTYAFELADFEIGSSFDNTWDGGGAGGGASGPYRLRFRVGDAVWPLGLLASVVSGWAQG